MRILLVTHLYPPRHRAGVEQYTFGLANGLARGDEVFVATTEKVPSLPTGTLRTVQKDAGVTVCEFVNNHDFSSREETYRNPAMEEALLELVREQRIDVVHFQHLMYWSAGLVAHLRSKGKVVFLTLHDYWLMCGRMGQLRHPSGTLCLEAEESMCSQCLASHPYGQPERAIRWIQRLTAFRRWTGVPLDGVIRGLRRLEQLFAGSAAERGPAGAESPLPASDYKDRRSAFLTAASEANAVYVPTRTFQKAFIDWGLPKDHVIHVAQGRDHSPYKDVSHTPRNDGPLRVAFLGQVAAHKGVLELIRAVKQLDPALIQLRIVGPCVGGSSYPSQCRREISEHANIVLETAVAAAEIPGILANTDVLAVPSLWNECSPLTIQEAFMAGVPVIASEIGGMQEMIDHEVSGLLVAPGDVDGLAQALRRLQADEPLRVKLSKGVPEVCSLDDHIKELRGFYSEALGGT